MKRIIMKGPEVMVKSISYYSKGISENSIMEIVEKVLLGSNALELDMRIRARFNLFEKTMYRI